MRRCCLFVFVLVSLTGCVAPAVALPKERIANFRHAHVVPMEAHPLGVSPGFTSQIPIQAAGGSISAVRGIGVFNTIAIFLEMPEASQRSDDASRSLQAILDTKTVWAPTVVLANQVSKQLGANGIAANVASEVKPIPGVEDRRATVTMENWMAPIRAHYNDPGPVDDYRVLASDQSLYVLEVSISNYELIDQTLLLQVHLKMINPSDGRVLGRSRAAKGGNLPPLKEAFANEAIRFKEVFAETGRELVSKCLTELGLISPALSERR